MHVLGQYGKDNAAAIFDLFLECMPEYPLDKPDTEGNTGKSLTIARPYEAVVLEHFSTKTHILGPTGSDVLNLKMMP